MHPNPVFRDTSQDTALEFARETGFGMLVLNGETEPLVSHIPFVIEGDHLALHLVRSNPIARMVKTPTPAKIIVSGPHSYVSPDWYGVDDQVPTWNYVAVHLTGILNPMPAEHLRTVLDELSEEFETRLLPKRIWTAEKMSEDALQKMMRMIQPFQFDITDIQSTFKLGQNKPDAARLAAAGHMESDGFGSEPGKLAALMESHTSKDSS